MYQTRGHNDGAIRSCGSGTRNWGYQHRQLHEPHSPPQHLDPYQQPSQTRNESSRINPLHFAETPHGDMRPHTDLSANNDLGKHSSTPNAASSHSLASWVAAAKSKLSSNKGSSTKTSPSLCVTPTARTSHELSRSGNEPGKSIAEQTMVAAYPEHFAHQSRDRRGQSSPSIRSSVSNFSAASRRPPPVPLPSSHIRRSLFDEDDTGRDDTVSIVSDDNQSTYSLASNLSRRSHSQWRSPLATPTPPYQNDVAALSYSFYSTGRDESSPPRVPKTRQSVDTDTGRLSFKFGFPSDETAENPKASTENAERCYTVPKKRNNGLRQTACCRFGTLIGILHLYASENDTQPVQIIDLQDCTAATSLKRPNASNHSMHAGVSLFEFNLTCVGREHIFGAPTAAECSAWVLALSMMISRNSKTTASGPYKRLQNHQSVSSVTTCGEKDSDNLGVGTTDTSLRMELQAMAAENSRLREDLAKQASRMSEMESTATAAATGAAAMRLEAETARRCSEAIQRETSQSTLKTEEVGDKRLDELSSVGSLTALVEAKSEALMQAIKEAFQGQNVQIKGEEGQEVSGTMNEVAVAVAELTESMELRTTRIGQMVHELLQRTAKKQESGPIVDVPRHTEDLKHIAQRMDEIFARVSALPTVPSSVTNETRVSGEATPEWKSLLKSLENLKAEQSIVSNDLSTLLELFAESNSGQRDKETEARRSQMEQHAAAMSEFSEIRSSLASVESRVEKLLSGSIYSTNGGEENGNQILAAISDVQSKMNDLITARSDSSSIEGDDLIQAKLDNILEVIDFVNKSQCRLVGLMTEKSRIPVPIKSPNHSTPSSAASSPSRKLPSSSEDTESSTINPLLSKITAAVSSLVPPNLSALLTETNAALRALQTTGIPHPGTTSSPTESLSLQLSRHTRDADARHQVLEMWMTRTHDLLKHVQRGVAGFERVERWRDLPGRAGSAPVRESAHADAVGDGGYGALGGDAAARVGQIVRSEMQKALEDLRKEVKAGIGSYVEEEMRGQKSAAKAALERLEAERNGLVSQLENARREAENAKKELNELTAARSDLDNFGDLYQAIKGLERDLQSQAGRFGTVASCPK
ncbi:hypothetical protein DFJ73DRAFT_896733 [Zopfochytrium polystomum]|nr:hypothetical protein DFJ73DRAFT_896733 [Zopfochytrium polystomum]